MNKTKRFVVGAILSWVCLLGVVNAGMDVNKDGTLSGEEVLDALLEMGWNMYEADSDSEWVFSTIIENNRLSALTFLLDYGIDESVRQRRINELLQDAVKMGASRKALHILLSRGGDIYSEDSNGETVISHVIRGGDICTIKKLYDYSWSMKNDYVFLLTALRLEVSKEVLEGMLSFMYTEFTEELGEKSILFIAIESGNWDAVRVLLENGASINRRDVLDEATKGFFQDAVRLRIKKLAQMFLTAGRRLDVYDSWGVADLFVEAALEGDMKGVMIFLGAGVSVNTSNFFGVTPLMAASKKGNLEVVRKLLKWGADKSLMDKDRHLRRIRAEREGIYLPSNRELYSVGLGSNTALTYAAMRGHNEVARLLISKGADVNTRHSYFAMKPIEWARYRGNKELEQMLLEAGAYD